MVHKISINEEELLFLGVIRAALGLETHAERLETIRYVKHDVIAGRLKNIAQHTGSDWHKVPENQYLADWTLKTSHERREASYSLRHKFSLNEEKYRRQLSVAELAGKLIDNSILDGNFEGVQTKSGILYQVTEIGRAENSVGARDKDVVRRCWKTYRGIVHLGIAMDLCEARKMGLESVPLIAEKIRRRLSENCPNGTSKPYVSRAEQISFVYESMIYGPRFLNRGLPFYVNDCPPFHCDPTLWKETERWLTSSMNIGTTR